MAILLLLNKLRFPGKNQVSIEVRACLESIPLAASNIRASYFTNSLHISVSSLRASLYTPLQVMSEHCVYMQRLVLKIR
jgi:hypothetical protein